MDFPYAVEDIIDVMQDKDYIVWSDPAGYDLNLVGIRTDDQEANTFNDWLSLFYLLHETWVHFCFPCTTDPGLYWREHPMRVEGTAILKPGQYLGAYKVGMHKSYEALQQKGNMIVYRDPDGDTYLDTENMQEQQGNFGINIHRAYAQHPSSEVNKWSAGCQVIQDPLHFDFFLQLCKKASEQYGNSFTYTLLEERDFYGFDI